MPTFFVVNPAAGKNQARTIWERVRPNLDALGEWGSAFTTAPGEATELAQQAARDGYDRVVAVGGDGTLTETANGLPGTGAALGLVPGGTGNDFARCAGIPFDPLAAAQLAMTGSVRSLDLGQIETPAGRRFFVNVAGIGFDAEVARNTNAYPKYLGGTVPYVLGILKTLWGYRPVPMELEADGRRLDRTVFLAAVGIGQAYGGGMMITPDALLDDGLFDVCIVGDLSRLEVLKVVPRTYSGGHRNHPAVEFLRCRELSVRSEHPVSAHADGEVVGQLPMTFRLLPGAMPCVTGGKGTADSTA